ncbi:MAG: hypothetical protein JOZ02_25035 [Acidobacteria bacterium]|nr:hypothetical protein [Acidobacteriota bacterium]
MPLAAKRILPFVSLLLFYLCAGSAASADATAFRDRASFEAAAQNVRTIDFESQARGDLPAVSEIDGVRFENFLGPTSVVKAPGSSNNLLDAGGAGEITTLTIYLPPGTTAVGCEQFSRPMNVSTSTGESVTMAASDGEHFVGFVTDAPVAWLRFALDFPEPTPNVLLDNLSFGQRRAGNEPPAPLLLTDALTGRAAAFDSVALTVEPFEASTPRTRNLASDGRTRVTLFVVGVRLDAPGDAAFVTARAVDAQLRVHDLPVEAVGGAKNLTWLSQVNVILPAELAGAGDLSVSVAVRGVESNKVALRVN